MTSMFQLWRGTTHLLRAILVLPLMLTLGVKPGWSHDDQHHVFDAHGLEGDDSGYIPLAPGYSSLGFDLPEAGSYRLPVIKAAPTGEVLLDSGEPVDLAGLFDNRYVLLSFIYSSCDDVNGCPLATFVMYQLHQRIQEDAALDDQLRLLTLSFDPINDSPEVMALYRKTFTDEGSSWRFLTAESEEILQPILEGYGQSVNQTYNEKGEFTGHFAHILRVYLIDPKAQIRNIYNVDFLHPDLLLTDVRTLMLEAADGNALIPDADQEPAMSVPWGDLLVAQIEVPPLGLPTVREGTADHLTPERVGLGRELFRDRRLSSNGTLSCSNCHLPQEGFTQNATGRAIGIEGQSLRRNSSSLLNVAYQDRLFWDGREFGLETLIWGKLLDEIALGNRSTGEVLQRLRRDSDLQASFKLAFNGEGIGLETVASALAAYLTTLVSGNSRFDRWYFGNERNALTAEEQKGFDLFRGQAGCVSCHTIQSDHALFMDQDLHNTGLGWEHSMGLRSRRNTIEVAGQTIKVNLDALSGTEARRYNDLGLYEVTQNPADRWRFRTPTLRDVELTSPYMHDGSISTLEEVVRFYNRGGVPHTLQAESIRPLGLETAEKAALVAFLKTLTGRYVDTQP